MSHPPANAHTQHTTRRLLRDRRRCLATLQLEAVRADQFRRDVRKIGMETYRRVFERGAAADVADLIEADAVGTARLVEALS